MEHIDVKIDNIFFCLRNLSVSFLWFRWTSLLWYLVSCLSRRLNFIISQRHVPARINCDASQTFYIAYTQENWFNINFSNGVTILFSNRDSDLGIWKSYQWYLSNCKCCHFFVQTEMCGLHDNAPLLRYIFPVFWSDENYFNVKYQGGCSYAWRHRLHFLLVVCLLTIVHPTLFSNTSLYIVRAVCLAGV